MGLQRAISEFVSTLLYEASQWPSLFGVPGGPAAGVLVSEFRSAGAVSRATAKRFHPRTETQEQAFASLLRSGVVRQPTPGRFYVDEAELSRYVRLWHD